MGFRKIEVPATDSSVCCGRYICLCLSSEASGGVEKRSVLSSSVEEEVRELRAAVGSLQNAVCLPLSVLLGTM